MRACHFLRTDMTSGQGNEPPWAIGEERTIDGELDLCKRGYHSSPTWYDALQYAPGPVACIVEISDPVASDESKQVSRSRQLIAARNVERELRLFGCDCAERVLPTYERQYPGDNRPRQAIEVSRRYAEGQASAAELTAAWADARAAAWAAAWAAARDTATDAARAAARDAARDATDAARAAAWAAAWAAARDTARDTEIKWQRARLDEIMATAFAEVT